MSTSTEPENPLGLLLGGIVMTAIFGFLTWLQIERIDKESYWIIFRVGFIPIPVIVLTGLGVLGGVFMFFYGIYATFKALFK